MAEKRGNSYSYDPITDVCIAGGLALGDDERGDIDTAIDIDDPLFDERLLIPLEESFVLNVSAFGVHTPIKIKKRDGVPCVVAGRMRVRAARRINRERVARGEPPMRIDAVLEASNSETRLMGVMLSENAARTNDDFSTTVAKMRRYMERGVSIEDAAITLNMPTAKAKAWLSFDDNAIDIVKNAVHKGTMSVSAGIEIVRAGTPAAQIAAFNMVFADVGFTPESAATAINSETAPKPTAKIGTRAARDAMKSLKSPNAQLGVADKRTQTRLLQVMRDMSHGKAGDKTIAFWEGAENMLMLIIGDDEGKEADERLRELLKETRKAMKSTPKPTKPAKPAKKASK